MKKGFSVFIACILVSLNAFAVNSYIPKKFNTITSYNDVYPYRLNNTKTNTKARDISSATPSRRTVVPRSTTNKANDTNNISNTTQARRVVKRSLSTARASANSTNTPRKSATMRSITPIQTRNATTARTSDTYTYSSTEAISSQRCFADYKQCMEGYCNREETAYNRCYCSAKLAQIDAKYQKKIDELIQKIIRLQYSETVDSDEIKEYWNQTVGAQTADNPWVNIENAINIEWADTQSRVRGQNAFNTGHEYCSQHLRACFYMSSNLRDAYKSEINRDCATYEKSLQKIQAAAESVIESYQ